MKTILQLCADTGSDTKPYKDAGYEVICIGKDIGVENYHPPKDVYGIIANPLRPGRNKPNMIYLHKSAIKHIPEFSCFKPESDMEFRSLCSQNFAKEFYKVNQ